MVDNITGKPLSSDWVPVGSPINASDGGSSSPNTASSNNLEYSPYLENQPEGQPNALNQYATYNALFTLAVLPRDIYNSGNLPPPGELDYILLRSQGDWEETSRVSTEFGEFDYFLDNLVITTYMSPSTATGAMTNATAIEFTVTEPYSMGLFFESVVLGSKAAGYGSKGDAVFLLCIEFAGYDDTGSAFIDPDLTRYLNIKMPTISMSVNNSGCIYQITANNASTIGTENGYSTTKQNLGLTGITVEEHLSKQTKGSLNFALNRALQQLKTDKTLAETDSFDIKFVDNPNLPNVPNNIGKAKLYSDFNRAGAQNQPDLNKIYDAENKIYKDQNLGENRVIHIPKDTPILSAIREVILRSDFLSTQYTGGKFNTDDNGQINWFIIRPRNEIGDYNPQLGRNNVKWIYEIMPWKVSIDRMITPGTSPPGYESLKTQIAKVYDYIYTGKNTEVLQWQIMYNQMLANLPTDLGTNTGNSASGLTGDGNVKQTGATLPNTGTATSKEVTPIVNLSSDKNLVTTGNTGGGTDTTSSIHNRILDSIVMDTTSEQQQLTMTIMGDPYWIANDFTGNKKSSTEDYSTTIDGYVNTFNGEVYVIVNFRTPIDLDPVSGNYRFAATLDTISGLYRITSVITKFERGKFTVTFQNSARLRAQTTTSSGSGFLIQAGQQGAGGYLSAGATDILSSALNIFGNGSSVFGRGRPQPNIGRMAGAMSGNLIGAAIGGAVNEIASGVGNIVGNLSDILDG